MVETLPAPVGKGANMPKLTAIRKEALDGIMREAIFEATLAVLAEHGVEGMTMDRVASAAKVAKGSLYYYFPGKKALLEFAYGKAIDPIFDDLEEVLATDRSAPDKLATHLTKLLEHVAKHAHVFKLLFQSDTAQGLLQSSQRRTHEIASQRLAEVFRQGIAEGAFRSADPLMLTYMFLGLCRGVLDSQPELEGRDQRTKVHHLIMDAFFRGIATEAWRSVGAMGGGSGT
jgi:AcrR family transcriptional regulator